MSVVHRTKPFAGPGEEESDTASAKDALEITLADPGPDTDTCKITLDRELSPNKTELFETHAEAEGWPMVQKLMQVPGVHSVIVKSNILIVAKHAGAEWPRILEPIENAIRDGLAPKPAEDASPVDVIAEAASSGGPDEALRARVQEIIDSDINPSVAAHGGYISLLDVQNSRVFLHMGGGCQGCGMAAQTLKHGVEAALRRALPEIREVLDTTDHASGSNPYYESGF